MEKTVREYTGKTVEEAISKGLKELGTTEEDAEIVVLEEPKKKLFGSTKARVQITVSEKEEQEETLLEGDKERSNEEDGKRAEAFLQGLLEQMKIDATCELKGFEERILIEVTAVNSSEIIGKRGSTLDALQTLASAVANTGRNKYIRVNVDCEGYRKKREETLTSLADKLAVKAIERDRKIKLEPMNPYERRVIHAALSDREDVTTVSEGKEPNRYVVIVPKNLTNDSLPAIPARGGDRNHRERGGKGNYSKGGSRGNFNKDKRGAFKVGGRPKPAGGGKKPTNLDFFGTFLGNSKDDQ